MPDTTPTTDRQAAVRAIHALKSPPPPGSQHYQTGWDTGLEAAIEAVQGVFEADEQARQVLGTTDQQPATADCTCITTPEVDDSGQVLHGSYCMTVIDQPATAPAPVDRAAVLREAADDPDGLLAKVDEATATLRRIRSTIRTLKDQGATGHAYYQAITDDLAGPRPDRDEADGPSRLADEAQQPKTEAGADTLPAWLYQRFMTGGVGWDNLDDDDRSYWEHHARAVCRAVARNGFKPAADRPDTETEAAKAGRLRCSLAFLQRPHTPHTWEPQPGMTPVACPGADTAP